MPSDKNIKYKRVIRESEPSRGKNEVMISARVKISNYVDQVSALFEPTEEGASAEKSVTLKGSGVALATVVTVAEALKRKYAEGRQISKLGVLEAEEVYEPVSAPEGTANKVIKRAVPFLEIEVAVKPGILDEKAMGYQGPLSAEEIENSASLESILSASGKAGIKGKGKGKSRNSGSGKKKGGGDKKDSDKSGDKKEEKSGSDKKEVQEGSGGKKEGGKKGKKEGDKKKDESSKKEEGAKKGAADKPAAAAGGESKSKGRGKGNKKNSAAKGPKEPAQAAVAA